MRRPRLPVPEAATATGRATPKCRSQDKDAGTLPVSRVMEAGNARSEPRPAVALSFSLGELSATADAMAAAHAGGVQIVTLVLRHLSCDWGDVEPAVGAANNQAVTEGGELRSAYRIAGVEGAVVVTTDAARTRTVARLASQDGVDG
jgi:hypothetical protein